jgi:hypothetical protein
MGGAYGSQKIPVTELIMVLIVTLACLSLGSLAPAIIAIPAVAYKYLFGRKHETSKIQQ